MTTQKSIQVFLLHMQDWRNYFSYFPITFKSIYIYINFFYFTFFSIIIFPWYPALTSGQSDAVCYRVECRAKEKDDPLPTCVFCSVPLLQYQTRFRSKPTKELINVHPISTNLIFKHGFYRFIVETREMEFFAVFS